MSCWEWLIQFSSGQAKLVHVRPG